MNDFTGNLLKEKEEAKEYLVSRGWVETKYKMGLSGWYHPSLAKDELVFFDQAWDLQYKEDEKMDKLRRPV